MESNLSNNTADELEKLVSSSADVSSQYVIFSNKGEDVYAINVAKVEGLLIYKELNVAKSSNRDLAVVGVSKIRDKMVTIVNFDNWIGREAESDENYELLMLCRYGGRDIGLLIKDVISIMSIDSNKLYSNSNQDEKISHICEIDIKREKKLCSIFDGDKLLIDIFPDIVDSEGIKKSEKISLKRVFFADDSKIVQKIVRKFFDEMEIKYEFFSDGKELLDRLGEIDLDEVGIIITDIEMPVVDGLKVLSQAKSNPKTKDIPIIINTNMANSVIKNKAIELEATDIINKIDLKELYEKILKFSR